MKRLCKSVDITDRKFISGAVYEALEGKYKRKDVLTLLAEAGGLSANQIYCILKRYGRRAVSWAVEAVIDRMHRGILEWDIRLPPIFYRRKVDGNSGKVRMIGIENIYQQLYEYVAVSGLKELFRKTGHYQCACVKGRGPHMGMRTIKRWLKSSKARYAWKADAHHYYRNIDTDRLKELLRKYVANDLLLKLVFLLLDTFEKGLSIGSYLSQYLANFYMSFAYHYATEHLAKVRKKRDGTQERVRLIRNCLIHMDDILFTGSSLKDLKMAARRFKKWIWDNLRIEIKPDDKFIDLREGYIDMVGFLSSKKKTVVRPRIFRRFRRDTGKVRRTGRVTLKRARSITSRYGWLKNCDCRRFIKRNRVNQIIKACKGAISSGKDVIYRTAAGCDRNGPSGRKKGRDGSDR